MSDNFKKVVIAILVLLIAGLVYYTYNQDKEHEVIENKMKLEKEVLLNKLTALTSDYDNAISKNTLLADELSVQREKIVNFRDSVKNLKSKNWKLMKFYKGRIESLNAVSAKLVKMNDSLVERNNLLNHENQDLYEQKNALSDKLTKQNNYNDTLVSQNLELAKNVALGKVVTASNFKVTTYKERKGKYKETDKVRRVDVFKTSVVLNENPIANNRDVALHIVIKKPDGELLVDKGVFVTTEDERIHYSGLSEIPYKKASIASEILTKFGDVKLEKGTYIVDFYIENKKVGTIEKNLR